MLFVFWIKKKTLEVVIQKPRGQNHKFKNGLFYSITEIGIKNRKLGTAFDRWMAWTGDTLWPISRATQEMRARVCLLSPKTLSTLTSKKAEPRQHDPWVDNLLGSHLVVDPRCDLELVVVLTFMVMRNGVVSIVTDKLCVNYTGRTPVFVYHDTRSADAGTSWHCWLNHTVPTPLLGIPNNKLYNLFVSLNLRAMGLRANLEYVSKWLQPFTCITGCGGVGTSPRGTKGCGQQVALERNCLDEGSTSGSLWQIMNPSVLVRDHCRWSKSSSVNWLI